MPIIEVDHCQVASGAHVPPSKFPYEDWDRLSSNYGSQIYWYQRPWYHDWESPTGAIFAGSEAGDESEMMSFKAAYQQDPSRFGVGEDVLSRAVDYGQSKGMEMYGWFTIGEENHYSNGPISRYATMHPEHLEVDSYGRTWYGRLSFAYPEVRAHKLALIREVINDYGVDGIFLDFSRRGYRIPYVTGCESVRDGVDASIFGYDSDMRSGYQAEYGVDPINIPNHTDNWVQYRCDNGWTQFFRDIKAEFPDIPVVAMVYEYDPATARRGDLLDWETWLADGLVDGLCFLLNNEDGGWMCGGDWNDLPNPHSKARTVMEQRKLDIAGRAKLIAGIFNYGITSPSVFESLSNYAYQGGADELMWWETGTLQSADLSTGDIRSTVAESSENHFREQAIDVNDTGFVTMYWRGSAQESYSLYYTENTDSGWTLVPGQGNIVGIDGIMQWTDDGTIIMPDIAAESRRFYKVGTTQN